MVMKKLLTWKAIFLLVLFMFGILIGFNVNKTRMELIQSDQTDNLILEDMKECCSFMGSDNNLKSCKVISSHTCGECELFCKSREEKGLLNK